MSFLSYSPVAEHPSRFWLGCSHVFPCHSSFLGLKRNIELLSNAWERVILFGIDKNLKDTVRMERVAEKETREFTVLNLDELSMGLDAVGVPNYVSDNEKRNTFLYIKNRTDSTLSA